jgi:hypothetical protein
MRNVAIMAVDILFQIALCVDTGNCAKKGKGNIQKQRTIAPKEEPVTPAVTQTKPVPKYLNVPFDLNIDRIPLPCSGHDVEQIYEAFDKRKKAERKDEFETTEQYQRRLTEQSGKPFFGQIGSDSVLAFVVDTSSEYDADSQTLMISIIPSAVWLSSQTDKSRLALKVKPGKVTKTKSTGQNAYGAKADIQETHVIMFNLAVHNAANFETENILDESSKSILQEPDMQKMSPQRLEYWKKLAFVHRLKMKPEEAREAKRKISALILAKQVPPHISYGEMFSKATLKDPSQFSAQIYYVDVDLVQIWVYDKTTGEIMAKIKNR